eukprot:5166918-Amphidinium_carterae.1
MLARVFFLSSRCNHGHACDAPVWRFICRGKVGLLQPKCGNEDPGAIQVGRIDIVCSFAISLATAVPNKVLTAWGFHHRMAKP